MTTDPVDGFQSLKERGTRTDTNMISNTNIVIGMAGVVILALVVKFLKSGGAIFAFGIVLCGSFLVVLILFSKLGHGIVRLTYAHSNL